MLVEWSRQTRQCLAAAVKGPAHGDTTCTAWTATGSPAIFAESPYENVLGWVKIWIAIHFISRNHDYYRLTIRFGINGKDAYSCLPRHFEPKLSALTGSRGGVTV
jgi:hypothetical protein